MPVSCACQFRLFEFLRHCHDPRAFSASYISTYIEKTVFFSNQLDLNVILLSQGDREKT